MPTPFAIFFAVWILLGIGGWIFDRRASYETKKSLHPFIVISIGVIFAGFVEWTAGWKVPFVFLGMIAIITFLNIRNIRSVRAVVRLSIQPLLARTSAQSVAVIYRLNQTSRPRTNSTKAFAPLL
ncbi:MAG: hypothetical protein ACXVZX_09540 [Terriglobales bacterium]